MMRMSQVRDACIDVKNSTSEKYQEEGITIKSQEGKTSCDERRSFSLVYHCKVVS